MIRYDIDKGYAKCLATPAIVVLALAATFSPLVEAWCAEDSELGKVGELRGSMKLKLNPLACTVSILKSLLGGISNSEYVVIDPIPP